VVQDDPKFLIDECDWEGVVCSRVFTPLLGGSTTNNTTNTTNGANNNNESKFLVTKIRWDYFDLPGTISSSIGLLSSLTSLDLSNNQLGGWIPDSLYSLTELTELYLFKNEFHGYSIPIDWKVRFTPEIASFT